MVSLRPPVETNTGENGTTFSNSSAETVGKTANTGWEYFTWDDEGSCVWTEVKEELGDDDEAEAGARGKVRGAGEDTEHET